MLSPDQRYKHVDKLCNKRNKSYKCLFCNKSLNTDYFLINH